MLRVAGVTILYNPGNEVLTNILSYLNQVELLYIVDNSDEIKSEINNLKSFSNVRFLNNKGNIGIAPALNKAANKAVEDGFDYLLTMDQDSQISSDLVKKMLIEFEKDGGIGVLAPFVVHLNNPKTSLGFGLEKIIVAMTSGSIMRLSAYTEIGGYPEELFIDYVDHEYCLRMKSFGFKVLQLNSVYVYHKLGAAESRSIFFKKVFPTNHSPLRWYYRTRNRFYVRKKYKEKFPDYVKFDKIAFLKENLKILLYEKNKTKKFQMIIMGYLDYRRNKFGKLI